jgi:hypothetical protein
MKHISNPKMVLDHNRVASAVFMANRFNTKFSNILPDKYVVYTLGLDVKDPHIEEMILVHIDKKNHSGILINIKGETVEFKDDRDIYGSFEEAKVVLDLINTHNKMVFAKKRIDKDICEANETIKEIDDTINIVDNLADIIELTILRRFTYNKRKELYNDRREINKIIRVTKDFILKH